VYLDALPTEDMRAPHLNWRHFLAPVWRAQVVLQTDWALRFLCRQLPGSSDNGHGVRAWCRARFALRSRRHRERFIRPRCLSFPGARPYTGKVGADIVEVRKGHPERLQLQRAKPWKTDQINIQLAQERVWLRVDGDAGSGWHR
jgi:hypothetical protein